MWIHLRIAECRIPFWVTDLDLVSRIIVSGGYLLHYLCYVSQRGMCIKGLIGPLYSQNLKVAFHQFHPIGLLEEWFKYKILAFI